MPAASPAVWDSWGEVPPGAFDDERDFDDYGIVGRTDLLADVAVRIDCGRGDPFYRNVIALEDRVDAEVHLAAGPTTPTTGPRCCPAS